MYKNTTTLAKVMRFGTINDKYKKFFKNFIFLLLNGQSEFYIYFPIEGYHRNLRKKFGCFVSSFQFPVITFNGKIYIKFRLTI